MHWNQNHFVVLYRIKNNKYYIADPGKGLITYTLDEFKKHWLSTNTNGEDMGIAMFLETTPAFFAYKMQKEENIKEKRSFRFLLGYVKKYRKYFGQIVLGLVVVSLLQLVLPFLTQSIVDVGIKNQDIGFVWLILLGQLMLTISRTAIDFIRRWLLLHISLRINISLLSDFFIKLLKLPMSFFDTKLMGDLMQRMSDHSRVNKFLTQQTLNITFAIFTFVVFSVVLFLYDKFVFAIFLLGSILYGAWMTLFLRRRKVLDYELFEQQAINNNKTYEFITSMQEIKLQDCEQRRRWEWEDTQADLFVWSTDHVSFEGNDNASYNCNITSHKARLIHREDGNYFMVIATVSTQGQKSPVLQKYMKADVRIIVSNKTLWQQVFG